VLVIRCPYCRELRSEEELEYGGEADIVRATQPDAASDAAWAGYLYLRQNTKGLHFEQWCCRDGCGQWFKVARDTVTHRVAEVLPFEDHFAGQRDAAQ
jgi:sarcosine oxidase subunit delta